MFRKILPVFLVLSLVFVCCSARAVIADQAKPKVQPPPVKKSEKVEKAKKPHKETRSEKARRYYGNGLWAEMQDNWDEAIKDFKTVTELEPKSYKSWLHLARAYRKASRAMDAISALNNAIKVEPRAPQAYLSLMDVYWSMSGLLKNVVSTGEKAMENGVSPAIILPDMGWYYYLAGDTANAEDCYKKAYKANPKNSVLVNNMGLLLFSESKYKEAAGRFREASKLNPNSVLAPYFEALSYNKLGKEHEALAALRAAVKKDAGLQKKTPEFNEKFFPRTDPGDISKLFVKLQSPPPALRDILVTAPAMKDMSITAPQKNKTGAAKGK